MNGRGDFLQQTDTGANFKNRFLFSVFIGFILFCSTLLPACGDGANNNSLLSGNNNLSGTDPTGPASGTERVNRGGGWYSTDPYRSEQASSSPTGRNSSIGFRCAANADSGSATGGTVTTGTGDSGSGTGSKIWIVGAWNISGSNNSGSSASGMMVFKSDYTYSNPYFFSSATSSGDKLVSGTWSYAGGILTYTRGDGECSGSAPEGSSRIVISCLYNWSWTLSR